MKRFGFLHDGFIYSLLIAALLTACGGTSNPTIDTGAAMDLAVSVDSTGSDITSADGITAKDASADTLADAQSAADAAQPCRAPTDRSLRLFFIGNSFTLGGPIPTLVGKLAEGAGFPKPHVESSAVGGYTLAQHRALPASTNGVKKSGWDFVVLQEYSTGPTDAAFGNPAAFKTNSTFFYDEAKKANPAVQVVLYETWARHPDHSYYPKMYKDPQEMQAQLRFHYNDAANNYIPQHSSAASKKDVVVAPAGDAWEKHLAETSPLRLHASDDYHAGTNGQYLNALVIFSTIYGCSSQGLPPLSVGGGNALRLQQSADAITKEVGQLPKVSQAKKLEVGDRLQIDFGPTSNSASGWNDHGTVSGNLYGLTTSTGAQTTIDLRVVDGFDGTNAQGRGDNTLNWPAQVSSDTLWVGSLTGGHSAAINASAAIEIASLPAGTYRLEVFASRRGVDTTGARRGQYTVAGVSKELDATNNRGQLLTFDNIAVVQGQPLKMAIKVAADGKTRFAYLGALTVERLK